MTRLISQFIGQQLSDDLLDKIVNHCTFNQMKNNPAVNRTQVPLKDCFKENNNNKNNSRTQASGSSGTTSKTSTPTSFKSCSSDQVDQSTASSSINTITINDESNTRFMRKGIIGDWKNYFSQTQSDQFDRMIKDTFK